MDRSGLEARYASRFTKYAGPTEDEIKKQDIAGSLADKFKTSLAVATTQKENTDQLIDIAISQVKNITTFQQASGVRQVRNIPLPTDSIMISHGKKLGYIKLCLTFFSAGMQHFMEENLELQGRIKHLNSLLSSISEHDEEVTVLGQIQDCSPDDLGDDSPIVDTQNELDGNESSNDEEEPPTPPNPPKQVTPTKGKLSLVRGMTHKKR